jgi:hypothetical protein
LGYWLNGSRNNTNRWFPEKNKTTGKLVYHRHRAGTPADNRFRNGAYQVVLQSTEICGGASMQETKGLQYDSFVKSLSTVIPAKAGIYNTLKSLDSGFRRNDVKTENPTFYVATKILI